MAKTALLSILLTPLGLLPKPMAKEIIPQVTEDSVVQAGKSIPMPITGTALAVNQTGSRRLESSARQPKPGN